MIAWLSVAGALALAASARAAPADGEGAEGAAIVRLERIVAVVDEDPIFASELERAARWAGDAPPTPRELLDQLIDERLRAHEVDRHGLVQVGEDAVRAQLDAVPPGVDLEEAERLVRRQLRILAYVEQRLGALVFVSDDAVRAYYDGTLREEMRRRGEVLPPFDEVQSPIRQLLREEALERRIVTWTEELRRRAEIIDLLDEPMPLDRLPPARLTIEEKTETDDPTGGRRPWRPIP